MAYIAPIHKPSSVRHALKLEFFQAEEDSLVVAKANSLDFYKWTSNGLALICSKSVYGRVTMLQKLRPASAKADHLFICTDRHHYFTVSWDPGEQDLQTEKAYTHLADPGARDSQTGSKCVVDPEGRFILLEIFRGVMTVVPTVQRVKGKRRSETYGIIGDPVSVRIPELFVRDMAFVHGSSVPKLVLLWDDGHKKVHLTAKEVDFTSPSISEPGKADMEDSKTVRIDVQDQGANHIIPVPEPVRGLIVLGESTILYVDDANNENLPVALNEATVFVAWMGLSDSQFILADDYGKLYIVELQLVNRNEVEGIHVSHLGHTSRASCLVHLGNDYAFVGSHQGDSQVIQLDLQQNSIQILHNMANIAPVLDFTIMDLGGRAGEGPMNDYSSGQARIVTGSGAFQDGSLRSIRSGVGLEDQGILAEMDGIQDLFTLRPSRNRDAGEALVVPFLNETRVFEFSKEGEVEELDDYMGFSLSDTTLIAANVSADRVVQVTNRQVTLVDAEACTVVSQWAPAEDQLITDAAVDDDNVLLSVGGTRLTLLDISADLAVAAERDFGSDNQVACVTLPAERPSVAIVGFWQSAAISILSLDKLEQLRTEVVGDAGGASVPRALLVTQLLPSQPPTLFVAMADGVVISFSLNTTDYSLSSKRSIVLGTQQARLRALPRGNGLSNVFATCEHPSLIYSAEGRIVYSAVTANEATCVCELHSEAYPGCIMVATSKELKIAHIDEERRTHVRDLHIGETARRVVYSTQLRAFAVGTVKRSNIDGAEIIQSHIKLVDEIIFDLLDTYDLNNDELVESVIRAELPDPSGELVERIVVGTAYLDDDGERSVRGRIIVFEVNDDRKLRALTELAVKGACRCLSVLDGKIVAGLIKTVVIYSLDSTSARPTLVKKASYRTSTVPIDLLVTDNLIAVADMMKSVSIVEYKAGADGLPDALDEIARHYQTTWATAVAPVANETYLESDAEGNLMVLHQNTHGVTEDDRRRLEVTSEMLLGEIVNRIRRIDVPMSPDAVVIPRAFLGTVDGSIYLFALISPIRQDLLMKLQTSLAQYVDSPGKIPFNKYRALKNSVREADEPFRFVDGELIEKFLDCPDSIQGKIAKEIKVDIETTRNIVESLKRLR